MSPTLIPRTLDLTDLSSQNYIIKDLFEIKMFLNVILNGLVSNMLEM